MRFVLGSNMRVKCYNSSISVTCRFAERWPWVAGSEIVVAKQGAFGGLSTRGACSKSQITLSSATRQVFFSIISEAYFSSTLSFRQTKNVSSKLASYGKIGLCGSYFYIQSRSIRSAFTVWWHPPPPPRRIQSKVLISLRLDRKASFSSLPWI